MSTYKQLHRLNFSFILPNNNIYYPSWKRWKNFVETCPQKDIKKYYKMMEEWKKNCKLDTNKSLVPIYDRYGGLYDCSGEKYFKKIIINKNHNFNLNIENKQNEISMDIIQSSEEYFWSVEELNDLISGFISTAYYYNKSWENNLDGYIQIIEIGSFKL
jgi:hypothetical protein